MITPSVKLWVYVFINILANSWLSYAPVSNKPNKRREKKRINNP
ncbi:Uncharacterised protein [uncultured archaeon]|nr:Uncharacterised protein [uncultured archaeon]